MMRLRSYEGIGTLTALGFWLMSTVSGFAYELSFVVEPGKVECFYQHVKQSGVMLEIDYQVWSLYLLINRLTRLILIKVSLIRFSTSFDT